MEIHARNVNEALARCIELAHDSHLVNERPSRNGTVLEFIEPVMTHYERPEERVLFSKERDANPFFHLFESMWMLAGRSDVMFPATVVGRMKDYSDDGIKIQGAYGYRWRQHFYVDQLEVLADYLARDPDGRRAVLTMWDPKHDLQGYNLGGREVGGLGSRDVPCNTQVYFKRNDKTLNMTVTCRSNDAIWGAYGANAVHFSFLMEYMADQLNCNLGRYTQLSDSLHIYTGGEGGKVWDRVKDLPYKSFSGYEGVKRVPMRSGERGWRQDLVRFFKWFDNDGHGDPGFVTEWWGAVIWPMWRAWAAWKSGTGGDALPAESSLDWFIAGREWLARRKEG